MIGTVHCDTELTCIVQVGINMYNKKATLLALGFRLYESATATENSK